MKFKIILFSFLLFMAFFGAGLFGLLIHEVVHVVGVGEPKSICYDFNQEDYGSVIKTKVYSKGLLGFEEKVAHFVQMAILAFLFSWMGYLYKGRDLRWFGKF